MSSKIVWPLLILWLLLIGEPRILVAQAENKGSSAHTIQIPFSLTKHNNILVKALLNDQEKVDLMFHLAVGQVSLTTDASKNLKSITWTDSHSVKSWGGESTSLLSKKNKLKIGKLTWDNITISQSTHSGKGSDGKFGPDLFKEKAVEIDFRLKKIFIHSKPFSPKPGYQKLSLQNKSGMMFVDGTCLLESSKAKGQFLLHTGYGGQLLLNDQFASEQKIGEKIKITEQQTLKDSYGNSIVVKKGLLPGFWLGDMTINDVSVGFFEGKVGRQKLNVIGCGLLKKFHLVISGDRKSLYIKPISKKVK